MQQKAGPHLALNLPEPYLGLKDKESACQCRRHGFDPWVRKISWRTEWQPTPVFLPGKSYGQSRPASTVHGVAKESDMT